MLFLGSCQNQAANNNTKEGEIIDLGVAAGIVEKSGSWYSYNGNRIGQGRENAKKFLLDNNEISIEIEDLIRGKNNTNEDPNSSVLSHSQTVAGDLKKL